MTPALELAFTMRVYGDKDNISNLGAIKSGPNRVIVPVTHGFIKGSGLYANILPGGADWLLMDPSNGFAYPNVRIQARTDDGESIYIHYTGVLKVDEALTLFLTWGKDAKTTRFGDHHWFSAPIMETSAPSYKWVEENSFVGHGRCIVDADGAQAVEYQIYKVTN